MQFRQLQSSGYGRRKAILVSLMLFIFKPIQLNLIEVGIDYSGIASGEEEFFVKRLDMNFWVLHAPHLDVQIMASVLTGKAAMFTFTD